MLSPVATFRDVEQFCYESKKLGCKAVFVNSSFLPISKKVLNNSDTKIGCSIGFPLGSSSTSIKVLETEKCLEYDPDEVDMQMHLGAFLSNDYYYIKKEIDAILETIRKKSNNIILKVIIESCYLTNSQIKQASLLISDTGADFIKTSSGFAKHGATLEAVRQIKKAVGNNIKIKASGGIKSYSDAINFIESGADRIGTSNGKLIINQHNKII